MEIEPCPAILQVDYTPTNGNGAQPAIPYVDYTPTNGNGALPAIL